MSWESQAVSLPPLGALPHRMIGLAYQAVIAALKHHTAR